MEKPIEVTIHCETLAKLNFACHQNAFAFLRELRIENNDQERRLDEVVVNLSSDPSFLKPKSWRLERIAPSGSISIKDRDVELDGGFLLSLADAMRGTFTIAVEKDGSVLAEEVKPVELLAYNEWGGAGFMPELLAAFSMPNDPAIDRVLRDASLLLRKAGKSDGIDGYKTKSRQRVWEIASAIYTAICNLGLTYSVPPASFERDGQKIRLPSHILENRVSTCLDSTMLFASALEQAGLNPIVALPDGHAVVGVWLQPEELSTIVIDEAEILRKRIQLKELVLIETTCVTSHPALPFSKAVMAAMEVILPHNDNTFNSAVDIRRARAHRIAPLGLKSGQPSSPVESESNDRVELTVEEAPALPDFDDGIVKEELPGTPAGRLERWQRKLLDLSARNPLLNHKSSKTSLRLICPEPGLLEDKLAEGARISIQSVPKPTAQEQDQELHRQRTGEVITEEYARDALDKNQVLVNLPTEELSLRAVDVYRKAQTALQEGGSNTLFLAIGFLLWKRDEKDERRFRAPLILLPVTLERKSVRSGIRMLAHDDEPRFNTTLLEMLRKDFQIDIRGLDGELPADHSGIDVTGVWNTVRKAVKDAPGFEVTEDVILGHFSFAKYLMWKDLVDRAEALRKSTIVKHLIDTPSDPYPSEIAFVDGSQVDRQYKPSDLLTPLLADSSQMAAIATADRGKDFIIIGPPGTGKSQTISNLIAHLLGKGKSVLFVSEKTAALEVVYRRLEKIGLGRFCLELHSNKARKADVLEQLRKSWEYHQSAKVETWEQEAERLRILRDQLNCVVNRLHVPRRNGMTAHYAIGVKIRDEDLASRLTFFWPSADQHDEARLNAMRNAVEKLRIQVAAVGNVSFNPLQLINNGDWSPQWEGQVIELAGRLSAAATMVERACDLLLTSIGITTPDQTLTRLDAIAELAAVLMESYRQQTAFALEPDGQDCLDALAEAVQRLKAYAESQTALTCAYDSFAWRKLDGDELGLRWKEAEDTWWPKSFFARRRIKKEMKAGGALGTPDPVRDAPTLKLLRVEGEAIERLDNQLGRFKHWKGHATNIDAILALQSFGQRARIVVGRLVDDAPALIEVRSKIRTLMHDGNDLLAPEASVGRAAQDFLATYQGLKEAFTTFEAIAGQSVREHFSSTGKALNTIRETADNITAHHAELNEWCGWRRRRAEAIDLDLGPIVEAVEQGLIIAEEIGPTFEAAYCTWWSGAVIGEDEVLRTFSSPEHVATIEKFREIDSRFQELTAAYIGAKLMGKLPNADDVKPSSSWGTLRREIQKKRQHKPVRQLVQEIPDVLTTLAPCLMMSPLSVAQYLPADQALFDVVIFDEASQITVWDAVGSLARGRQAIVAGDPKQMPPTNFFARADDDPDGEVDTEGDLESILDEMIGASIPQRVLNLHYRSRRESLIAFSNSRYYDNGLVTFPAPIHPDRGVRLVQPNGFYARGKARHNKGEATAIVAEILHRLTHKEAAVREQSIGVVTFNSEQQSLIEQLLDEERSRDPQIEWAFSTDTTLEPVFVKNLETVQGDERDVILFSITYGPDQSGHVTMNFGPLNRDGGERRLNVAMTRARSEMLVFSTLNPDRIDLSRTQARAVADLKHFLEYAERGPTALGAAVFGSIGDFESPFETAVARALRDKGWNVHPQIGVSAYRIDLGVVHPDEPGIYLAGIECDGAMYHSSAFARERDKIRQSVLKGLGWTLFRVWSTDWWTHHHKALNSLHEALNVHLKTDRQKREEAAQAIVENTPDSSSHPDAIDEDEIVTSVWSANVSVNEPVPSVSNIDPMPSYIAADLSNPEPSDGDMPITKTAVFSGDPVNTSDQTYVIARLEGEQYRPDSAMFYSEEYEPLLSSMIEHVIDTEGPIHEDILIRRIARHHGFQRAGRQIRDIVIAIAKSQRRWSNENVGLFFWREGMINERFAPARHDGRNEEMRKVEYICEEEIRAIGNLLGTGNDPTELARCIGIARLSPGARERLSKALDPSHDMNV